MGMEVVLERPLEMEDVLVEAVEAVDGLECIVELRIMWWQVVVQAEVVHMKE